MANSGRNYAATLPRLLQLGIDKEITHFDKAYIGPYQEIFDRVVASKGFYEIVELSGMGPAARRNEGQVLTNFDTINQDFNPRYTIYTYEKAARASMEAIADNLYESLVERMAQCISTSHNVNKDIQAATILNNCTTDTWGDGKALIATDHPIQAGGTNSNRLSPDLDLSLDALYTAILGVQAFVNPDGLLGQYETETLVVPPALQFIADVCLNSRYKTGSNANDINALNRRGDIKDYIVWRRLTSGTTWFVLTNQKKDGLILAEKQAIETKTFEDNFTHDTIVNSWCRFRFLVGDHRRVIGSVGP